MCELDYEDADYLANLRLALEDAVEGMEEMLPYVPEYFRTKWSLDEFLNNGRKAVAYYCG